MTAGAIPRWAAYGLVGALALASYVPSLGNGFALDDVPAVAQDIRIRTLAEIPDLLAAPYLTYMPRERSPYRPVTTVSYAVSWALGQGRPAAFHLVNIVAHAGAALLLLSVLLALGAGRLPAALAAAVFAVHPVHVEAVAGVVGRADVLATLLCLAAVRVYLARGLRPVWKIPLVSAMYLMALGAKESAVVLPLLIVVVEALRVRLAPEVERSDAADATPPLASGTSAGPLARLAASWPTHAALAAALGLFLFMRSRVLGAVVQLDVAAYIVALPASLRVTTAVANLAEVARLLLVPWDLVADYGPGVVTPAGPADARFWAGVATLVLALGLLAFGLARDGWRTWLALGVAWIALSFALVSNLVLPMPMWIAERTLYLPSVGVALCLVGVLSVVPLNRLRHAVVLVAAVCLVGAAHSWRQSRVWESDEALFGDLVSRHPESFRAQWWLGGRMVDSGDVEGGLVWLGRAVENSPNSVLVTLDYARALLLTGRSTEAEALLRPIRPTLHPSRSVFLAQSLIFQDRQAEAVEVVREGLRFFPDEPRLREQARLLGIGG